MPALRSRRAVIWPVSSPRRGLIGSAVLVGAVAGALVGGLPAGAAPASSSVPPAQLVQTALATMHSLTSVTVRGSIAEGKHSYALNVASSSTGTAEGTVSTNGQVVNLKEVGGTGYFRGSKSFLEASGATADQAARAANIWYAGPASGQPFSSFASFLDTTQLVSGLTSDTVTAQTTWSRGGTAKVGGRPAVVLVGKSTGKNGGAGKVYVASSGTPYVLAITATKGSDRGTITFSAFDQPVTVTPPPHPENISQLGQ